jgi:hypothetical protein
VLYKIHKDANVHISLQTKSKIHHLADLKIKVGLVSASLGRTIRAGNSSATRLVTRESNSVQRVVSNAIAVRSTPNQLCSVGRVVVRGLGKTIAVALTVDGGAVVAAVGCDLHLSALLVLAGGGEEDVLLAVVLDACGAGEGGGGESEGAGDEGGGVHGCGGSWFLGSEMKWSWLFGGADDGS